MVWDQPGLVFGVYPRTSGDLSSSLSRVGGSLFCMIASGGDEIRGRFDVACLGVNKNE